MEQHELVSAIRQKKKSGMDYLYDNYSSALFGSIVRIVKSSELAEEVLHDALLKIWNNIDKYDETKGRFFTWMINICRNLAIDRTRSKGFKAQNKSEQLENIVNTKSERDNPLNIRIEDVGVRDLLIKLREEERIIVDLVYFQGFTQSEIAKKEQMPLGTVKTRLRMGLQHIREILNVR